MDVTTLGIKLDAQPFIDGERKVTEALGRIMHSVISLTAAFESQARASQAAFGTMTSTVTQAAQTISSGMSGATQQAGRNFTQFGSSVRQTSTQVAQSLERQRQSAQTSLGGMNTAARSAASGMRSAFDTISSSVGTISPKLGFALQSVRNFVGTLTGLGSEMASLATQTNRASGGMSGFASTLMGVTKAAGGTVLVLGSIMAVIAPLVAVLLPLVAAFKASSIAFDLFKGGLAEAAAFETLKIRFAGVLGSIEAAEDRMRSLARLAAETPFDLQGISKASLALETLTGGLFSSEKALVAVGNAAARSGQTIEETAEQIGRIFSGLQTGVGFDDPLRTLTARGVFEPQVYQQLMAMNKEGAKFSEMWAIITAQLARAEGSMVNLSQTFNGRVSTMQDAYAEFKRALGEAILPAAVDTVKLITQVLERLVVYVRQIQPEIQNIADTALAVLRVMMEPGGFNVAMKAAADTFAQALDNGFTETANKILAWVKDRFGVDVKQAFEDVRNADIWKILETEIIPKIATAMANALRDAIITAFAGLGDLLSGGLTKKVGESMGRALGATEARRAGMPPLLGELPTSPAGGFIMGQRLIRDTTDTESQAPLPNRNPVNIQAVPITPPFTLNDVNVNLELPSDFVPKEGATGAELLLPDIGQNTKAITSLTDVIEEVRRQSPASRLNEGPSAALFPQSEDGELLAIDGRMSSQTDFIQRIREQRAQIDKERQRERESMTFVAPTRGSMDVSRPAPKAKELKEKRDPMETEAARITEQMRNPAEVYRDTVANLEKLRDKFAETGKFTTETFNRAMAKAKEDYTSSVKAMEAAAKAAAEAQMTELQKLGANWSDMAKQVDQANVQIAQSIASNLTDAFVGIINGTKSASDAFAEMADRIVADLLRIITQMMVAKAIGSAIGFFNPVAGQTAEAILMPQGAGGFLGGAKTAAPAPVAAPTMHTGGVVGETMGASKVTDPKIFKSAPRYHQGGMVGLQPGEVPIIAQKGEVISTEDQERMRERLRGDTQRNRQQIAVTNVNIVDATMIDEHLNKNPDAIINLISRQKGKVKQILNIGT